MVGLPQLSELLGPEILLARADHTVAEPAGIGMLRRIVNRDQQFHRRVWKLAQNRLASDDDESLGSSNSRSGANDVFKLKTLHGAGDP